jgi:hypothetical protein
LTVFISGFGFGVNVQTAAGVAGQASFLVDLMVHAYHVLFVHGFCRTAFSHES